MELMDHKNIDSGDTQAESTHFSAEYVDILIAKRRFIGCAVAAAFVLSIIISLSLPKMYIATAKILPPKEPNFGIASILSGPDNPLNGLAGSLFSNQTPAALYVGIMQSRTVADKIIKQFDLKERYSLKYIEDVYKRLANRSTINFSRKDQLISVSVIDRDPQRAADMANSYVEMLDRFNRKLTINQGYRKRKFLEGRMKEVFNELEKAESKLQQFQEKYHLVSITEQAKASIKGAAQLKSQIIATETELEVFKQFGTEQQVEAAMLKAKIEELRKQLRTIEEGSIQDFDKMYQLNTEDESSSLFIPFAELPELAMQFMRLTREAKIQVSLFELITTQYEMAKLEEARDVYTIQVLDQAVPAEKKYRPHRLRIVATSTFLVFFAVVFFVLVKEFGVRSKSFR
jgi:tyrosine-protein kinase Etk/Wzc